MQVDSGHGIQVARKVRREKASRKEKISTKERKREKEKAKIQESLVGKEERMTAVTKASGSTAQS